MAAEELDPEVTAGLGAEIPLPVLRMLAHDVHPGHQPASQDLVDPALSPTESISPHGCALRL